MEAQDAVSACERRIAKGIGVQVKETHGYVEQRLRSSR
jgi:hypothetical protein